MPDLSVEFWIATGVAILALLVGLAVTLAMDAKTRGEFRFAVGCFIISASIAVYGVMVWQMSITWPSWARVVVAYGSLAFVLVLTGEAIRWAHGRHQHAATTTESHDRLPLTPPPGATLETHGVNDGASAVVRRHEPSDSASTSVQPLRPSIKKTRRLATLVPILPTNPNVPVPMNQNFKDSHSDFYSDLLSLAGRPDKPPAGWPAYQERNFSDLGSEFAVRLMQFYVFRSIFYLIRGRSGGSKITLGEGVTPIEREPISPPDVFPYPIEQLVNVVKGNQFYGLQDQMIWTNPRYPLLVPKGTRVLLTEQPAHPEKGQMLVCTVRFERPDFYKLDFDVSSGAGANDAMPAGFLPQSIPGATTWTVTVTMNYGIQNRHDEGFQPESYSAWAEALFDGLQKQIAF